MNQTLIRTTSHPPIPCLFAPKWSDRLWAFAYRSRPHDALDQQGLKDLIRKARRNNAEAGISGVLVVGKDALVQWLEGPEMAVRELMARIVTDKRHSDVTVLDSFPIRNRLFKHWSMLFASEDPQRPLEIEQTLRGRTHAIADVKSGEESARDVFKDLADLASGTVRANGSGTLKTAVRTTEELIDALLASTCLPNVTEKVNRMVKDRPLLISALARLALDHELTTLESVLRQSSRFSRDPLGSQILMLEQTERQLGDMWECDSCSEVDITLALLEMISAMRSIHLGAKPRFFGTANPPAVLVVSEPGELHLLPAVLDAEVLFQRGWQPKLEFPASDQELTDRLSSEWFEAVDISLSDVFRREHWVQRLRDTIASIRKHSLNPDIAITVSGRIFRDRRNLLNHTGADGLVYSASEVERVVTEALCAHGVTFGASENPLADGEVGH